ncbi:MAG: hypothetical protein IK099_08775 [Clostridia bacterium]|nr:hypothetical protein [Clostridia bacterium]
MKKIIALALSLTLLLGCVSALAETAKQETLTMPGAFSVKYPALPGYYSFTVEENNEMSYRMMITPKEAGKPVLLLTIDFNDEWYGVNTLADATEEDMAALRADFYNVTELNDGEIVFEETQTNAGIPVLVARAADGSFGAVYTIYMSHEIEIDIFPNAGIDGINEEAVQAVLAFLGDAEFVPLETKE